MLGRLSVQSVLAVIAAFLFVCALIPMLRRPAEMLGLMDIPNDRKIHLRPIPLVGGVAMFVAFCCGILLIPEPMRPYASLVVGMGLMLATGMVDDAIDITPAAKLIMQLFAATLMVSWGEVQIHSLGNLLGTGNIELGEWTIPFTVLCVVFMINAVNMLDGADGQAGGAAVIILGWLAILGWSNGVREAYIAITLMLVSVSLGFLVYNFRFPWRSHASVFMGDAGSMMLGFAIAWLAVYVSQHPWSEVPPISVGWLLVLPVADLVASYFRRIIRGRSPFSADREHFHHFLQHCGMSVTGSVIIVLSLLVVCGGIGYAGWRLGWPEPALFFGLMLVFAGQYVTAHFTREE